MIGHRAPDTAAESVATPAVEPAPTPETAADTPKEYGGREGLDPVRYGDWEKNGRCIDF